MNPSRRQFLTDVGRGVLTASVGSALAADLGLAPARAAEAPEALAFGAREPLVTLMQETPAAKLLPLLVERLRGGTELRDLVAAAALSNARTFGGEDYVGFHTMMALAPAWHMARELPAERQALPILKVLFRNTTRIQEKGGRKDEVLRTVRAAPAGGPEGRLRDAVRARKVNEAEGVFAGITEDDAAMDAVIHAVADATEVHRVVLPYRAWDLLPVIGREHAHTLLRQSVRYCVKNESDRYISNCGQARELLPRVLTKHGLLKGLPAGAAGLPQRRADDAAVEKMSQEIFAATAEDAAGIAAEALAAGFPPDAVAEAISLAVNQLVLRDVGRLKEWAQPNKPEGSVHGDGIGVHACDSANAWRNLARAGTGRHAAACLVLGAYQAARDRAPHDRAFLTWEPYPRADAREKVTAKEPETLLRELEGAIKEKDQARASAVAHRYGELKHPERPVFDLLLRYAVSQDGALHAEKYYRTVTEEFAATRPAFRWRQVVALARVTASAYGYAAPGHDEACRLLKV